MREIGLESNRLAMPVMDLRSLSHLNSLQLWGNPLEFVPELSPCSALRRLSLVNVSAQNSNFCIQGAETCHPRITGQVLGSWVLQYADVLITPGQLGSSLLAVWQLTWCSSLHCCQDSTAG